MNTATQGKNGGKTLDGLLPLPHYLTSGRMAIALICKVERGLNFSYMYNIKASKVSTTYNILSTQTEGSTIINLDVSSRELDNAIHNLTIPNN